MRPDVGEWLRDAVKNLRTKYFGHAVSPVLVPDKELQVESPTESNAVGSASKDTVLENEKSSKGTKISIQLVSGITNAIKATLGLCSIVGPLTLSIYTINHYCDMDGFILVCWYYVWTLRRYKAWITLVKTSSFCKESCIVFSSQLLLDLQVKQQSPCLLTTDVQPVAIQN